MIWPLIIAAVLTVAGAAAKANAGSKAAQQGATAQTQAGLADSFTTGKGLRLNSALQGSGYPTFGGGQGVASG